MSNAIEYILSEPLSYPVSSFMKELVSTRLGRVARKLRRLLVKYNVTPSGEIQDPIAWQGLVKKAQYLGAGN